MDLALAAVKERRRSLRVHFSLASSEHEELRPSAVAGIEVEPSALSPEGFQMSDEEEEKKALAAPGAEKGAVTQSSTYPAAGGDVSCTQMGDWLTLNQCTFQVLEVASIRGRLLFECVYAPPRPGLQSLPIAITADTPGLRKLSEQEKEMLMAKVADEALQATGAKGKKRKGGRGGTGGKCGLGKDDGKHLEEPKPQVAKKEEEGKPRKTGQVRQRAPSKKQCGNDMAVPDAKAAATAAPSMAASATTGDKAADAVPQEPAPPTPVTKGSNKSGSPHVSMYKTAASAGRAAYRRQLARGGTRDEANARNRTVMQEWRLCATTRHEPTAESPPAPGGSAATTTEQAPASPPAPGGDIGFSKKEFFSKRLAELAREKGCENIPRFIQNRKFFGQVVKEWFAQLKLTAEREKEKSTMATAVLENAQQHSESQPLEPSTPTLKQEPLAKSSPDSGPVTPLQDGAKSQKRAKPGGNVSRRKWHKQAPCSKTDGEEGAPDQQPACVEALPPPVPDGANDETSADVAAVPNEGTTTAPHEGGSDDEPLGMDMDELLM